MAPKRVSWTDKNMAAAVHAVVSDFLSIRAAADIYQIPPRTLRDHVKRYRMKRSPHQLLPGKKPGSAPSIQEPDKEDTINNNTDTSWFNIQRSWYCHACRVDKMADMRQCMKCFKWYHEVCVGLTADDTDPFECPIGC